MASAISSFPVPLSPKISTEAVSYTHLDVYKRQRYSIQTAHSTVIRFRVPLVQPVAFVERLQTFYAYDFGTFEVNMLELVYNDWYQRSENTLLLESFYLGN